MSLDISIRYNKPKVVKSTGTGIFVRDNGCNRELTREEVAERYPDFDLSQLPDESQEYESREFWWRNITHNLTEMASYCVPESKQDISLYDLMWCDEYPADIPRTKYITYLVECAKELEANPDKYKQYNPKNGWGSYEGLLSYVKEFAKALIDAPQDTTIEYSR